MGLLERFTNMNPEQSQGLLAAASQILQASGDPRRPFGFGQAAGLGLEAYQQHNELAKRRKQQEEEAAQLAEMRRMQMEASRFNLGREQRAAAKEDEIAALAPQYFRTPEQMAASLPGGPTNENAAQISNMKPGFDIDGYAEAVMQRDPLKGMAIKQQFAKQAPQVDRVDIATDPQTNKLVRVITFKDGSEKVSPFDPKSDMTEMDLGGVKQWVDKNRVSNGQTFQRTMSPDAAASNRLGWANHNLSADRLNFDKEQPRGQIVMTDQGPMLADPRAGTARPITGPDGQPVAKTRPLPAAVLKQVQEVRDNAATMGRLNSSFKPDYAGKGVLGFGADAQLGAAATLGVDQDSVGWWKQYKKEAELVERHALFGASLTATEQGAWRAADISPGMAPETIKANLKTRAELAEKVRNRTRDDLIDAGHNPERITSIANRDAPKETPGPTMNAMPKANASNKGRTLVENETGKKYRSNGLSWVEIK